MGVSGQPNVPLVNPAAHCHCSNDERLVPSRSKMKVLKKLKKRIGLSPKSSNSNASNVNNLPPLQFHQVHGENVRLFQDGAIARRVESFCRGVTFTSRPIKIMEKICVNFQEISNSWSGVLRFGFTSTDPSTLRYNLPKYACPDLTNKPGYWAKALAERFAERNTVLYYYVTAAGDVHFGINGEEKGLFFSGVDTRSPLWGLFDIYGNSTGLELISPRTQLNNCRRNESEDAVLPHLQALSLNTPIDEMTAASRYYSPAHLSPLPFHKTRGQNVRLSNDRCVAARSDAEFCHGYVFTSRPMRLEEKCVIQIMATESMYMGALAFGLTSCDPGVLSPSQLPEDADSLLDRREYWVVSKDIANSPQRGDELAFSVTSSGEVTLSKNGGTPVVIMHVDHTLQLWAFFDVYGSTQKIRSIGAMQAPCSSRTPLAVTSGRNGHRPSSTPPTPLIPASHPPTDMVQLQPTLGGGTVLVVNLPPAQSNYLNQQSSRSSHMYQSPLSASFSSHPSNAPHHQLLHQAERPTIMSNYGSTYVEPISAGGCSTLTPWLESTTGTATGSECSVCYERAIDSVLYMCGHMCMCYECAVQQWRGKGGGHCPLCRAVIRDVIRTYKS